jgi:ribose 5-phosphate isomerase B
MADRQEWMRIALGSDHAGFPLKGEIAVLVREFGHEPLDLGAHLLDPGDDYPDFARLVAEAILEGRAERGALICGTGIGASIAANKFQGIRAGLCHDTYSARQAVEHYDMNVLCIGACIVGPAVAADVIRTFLGARFSGEARHVRRLQKILSFE